MTPLPRLILRWKTRAGVVAHTRNPSTQEAAVEGSQVQGQPGQHARQCCLQKTKTKIIKMIYYIYFIIYISDQKEVLFKFRLTSNTKFPI
jgi:hypothetical protein